MGVSSKLSDKLIFSIFIICSVLQDLPTANLMGTIARTPIFFLAPILFVYLILKSGSVKLHLVTKYFLYYFIVSFIISLIMMFITIFFFTEGNWYKYDEFMPVKLIKASQYNFIFFLFSYIIFNLVDKLDLNFILKVFQGLIFFLALYGCVETMIDYPLAFLHGGAIDEWKTRLTLTGPEPSATMLIFSCIVFSTLILRTYLNKNIYLTVIISIISLVILLGIGSKSGVAFIIISLLWVLRKHFSLKFLLITIVISIPVIIFIVNFVIPTLLVDIDEFASLSTRSTTMLVAIKSLFVFPLGQGYGSYIVHFPNMLLPMHQTIVNITGLPLLDFEMRDMITTGKYLGVKTGILQEVLYNGFIAVIFFYYLFRYYFKSSKSIKQKNLQVLFLFSGFYCLIELLFTAEYLTAYYILFPFIILYRISENNKAEKIN